MDIEELCGGVPTLLQTIIADPAIHSLRDPADAILVAGAYAHAKRAFVRHVVGLVVTKLQDALDEHTIMAGERPDVEHGQIDQAVDEWDSAIDDKLEVIFQPYERNLSADWLARNTIDSRLHAENRVPDMAKSFAEEMWKFHTLDHDPEGDRKPLSAAKVMSRIGLTAVTIREALAEYKPVHISPQEQKRMDPNSYTILDTMQTIRETVSMIGMSEDTLMEELDGASDSDDGLAMGAIARLGGSDIDVENLRTWRLTDGDFDKLVAQIVSGNIPAGEEAVTVDEVSDEAAELALLTGGAPESPADANSELAAIMGGAAPASAPAPTAAPVSAEPPKAKRRTKAEKEAEELAKLMGDAPAPDQSPEKTGVPTFVLEVAKQFSGLTDVTLAEKLGVSKSTFINYLKARAVLFPDDDQLTFLRTTLYEISSNASNALAQLDEYIAAKVES